MKRISLLTGGILGALTALTVVGLTYLGEQFVGLPFVPFDTFDWMTRVLPGGVITFVIDTLVRIISGLSIGPTSAVAKSSEQTIAIVQFILAGTVFGVVLAGLARARSESLVKIGALLGLVLVAPTTFVEIRLGFPAAGPVAAVLWLAIVFVGWGMLLARLVLETAPEPVTKPDANLSRRQFLYLVGAGSFTVLVAALGVNVLSKQGGSEETAGTTKGGEMLGAGDTSGAAASPPQDVLDARFDPAPGTRPELTSNDDFYRIDINTRPPEVDGETWRLEVGGLVFQALSLSLADLRSRPSVSQAITLSCISNEIGGDLISTSVWTGVRLKDILEEAGLRRAVEEIAIEAVDGFYESVPLEEAMDERTLLVYEMNGEPLPVKHGYPLRIYIPNHYGMKQPKWIKRMEAIDHHGPGYWVDRGWSETAIPQTTSVIDTVAVDDENPETGVIPVGGIAYSGARGISKVEVQVDEGPWQEVELRSPALSPLTWVQWRYLWKSQPGRHTFKVRAYDGTGQLQETQPSPPHPNGATGIDSKTENIRS
jgi:DMSO/TMAO reductase YedYZ molybdopterin-dependent catalytic subunit